jgi:hypothetical protein
MHVSWNRQPVGLCFFPYRHRSTWEICVDKHPRGNCHPLRFEARKQPVNSGAACGAEVEFDISATLSFAQVAFCRTGRHYIVALPIATDGDNRSGATLAFSAATGSNQFWLSSCVHIQRPQQQCAILLEDILEAPIHLRQYLDSGLTFQTGYNLQEYGFAWNTTCAGVRQEHELG